MDDDQEIEVGSDDGRGSFWGNAVLIVITVAFVIGALPMTKMAFGPLVQSALATQWEPVPAVIQSSVVAVPDRRQYLIEARYQYEWQGTQYSSDSVFFDEMVGVRKSYYHQISRQLLRHKSPENPITAWVNPNAPEQAVLFRHVRWDKFLGNMILFSIWAGITAVLAGASLAAFRK
jgi:hypothetical protein